MRKYRLWNKVISMRSLLILSLLIVLQAPAGAVEVTPADSPVKLDLYGVILANTYWNWNGVFGSDVPLWVVSGDDIQANDTEFGMTARQSRFGFKVKAPDVGSAKLSGVLEMDLFGGFPESGQAASFANLRVRLAYVKVDWENASFTAGQDWIILAPLNPSTLSHFAVVGFASSGNLWLRYPQLRFDLTHPAGDGKFGLTAGIVRPVTGTLVVRGGTMIDFAGPGERSGMPFFQTRVFYTKPVGQKTLAAGFSAHYGQESYKTGPSTSIVNKDLDTWAVAGDFQIPMGSLFSVQGEIYTGSNLDSFMGGINQGFSLNVPFSDPTVAITAIDSTGGWFQASLTPPQNEKLTFNVAYGIDNPDDADLSKGQRSENWTIMANAIYKFSKNFQAGFEYDRMNTKYSGLPENSADVVNIAFGFWF